MFRWTVFPVTFRAGTTPATTALSTASESAQTTVPRVTPKSIQ